MVKMKIKAEQKFIRTSPRKIRIIAETVRQLSPRQALDQLKFMRKRSALTLHKVINQAVANATNNHKLDESSLKFNSIEINEGPTYKRWRAVSRGRAHSILKRTSHIKVTLISSTHQPIISTPQPTTQASTSSPKTTKSKLPK